MPAYKRAMTWQSGASGSVMAPVVESLKKRYSDSWGKLNLVADAAIFTGFVLGCVAFAPDQLPGGGKPDCPAGSTFTELSYQSLVTQDSNAATQDSNADALSAFEKAIEEKGLDFDFDTTIFSACSEESNPLGGDNMFGALAFTIEPGKTPSQREVCAVSTTDTQYCGATADQGQFCLNLELVTMVVSLAGGTDADNPAKQFEQVMLDANGPVAVGPEGQFVADCSSLYDNMYALVTAAVSVALAGNLLCLAGRIRNRDEPSGWVLGTAYVLYFIPLGLAYGYLYSSDLPGTPVTRQQTAAGLTVGVTALHFIGGAIEASGGFGGKTYLTGSNLDTSRLLSSGAF